MSPGPSPIARLSDPESAKIAALYYTESGRRAAHIEIVRRALMRWPGCTAHELAEHLRSGIEDGIISEASIWKRLSDLKNRKEAETLEHRICRMTGYPAAPWYPTAQRVAA